MMFVDFPGFYLKELWTIKAPCTVSRSDINLLSSDEVPTLASHHNFYPSRSVIATTALFGFVSWTSWYIVFGIDCDRDSLDLHF